MSFADLTTIAAIATPKGQGGVSIIRISGPQSWTILAAIFSKPISCLKPWRITHGWIQETQGEPGQLEPVFIDEVLVLPFKAPRSFTGEDLIEIHCHGGEYVTGRILDLCYSNGAKPAQAGEFTQRAFLNGRLDLTQAESVMDIIAAQGEDMLQVANQNLKTRYLGNRLDALRSQVLGIQGDIVANVDFPDEVEEPDRASLCLRLRSVQQEVSSLLTISDHHRWIREGLKIAILGMPNAGKSSIFNALLMSERAIVTDIAGTTRDVISESFLLDGVPFTLLDTAGIRETEDLVESLGVQRSLDAGSSAQGVLYVVDSQRLPNAMGAFLPEDSDIIERLGSVPCRIVANKVDVTPLPSGRQDLIGVSAKTGQGLRDIMAWLQSLVKRDDRMASRETAALCLNQRQREQLVRLQSYLEEALHALEQPAIPLDVVTVPLSSALISLDALTGRDTVENVLGDIFSRFCVGK